MTTSNNILFSYVSEINVRWDNIFENPTGSSNRLTLGYILLAAVINIYISIFCSILYTTWHSRRIRLQVKFIIFNNGLIQQFYSKIKKHSLYEFIFSNEMSFV